MKTSFGYLIPALWITTLIAFSGCGGGGDDDDDAGGAPPPPANSELAPSSIAGRSIQFTHAGGVVVVDTFASDGNGFSGNAHNSDSSESGTFTYTKTGNTGTIVQSYTGGDEIWTHQLTFQTAESGTFTEQSSKGQTGSGTFRFVGM
jgi:hypothetical protein